MWSEWDKHLEKVYHQLNARDIYQIFELRFRNKRMTDDFFNLVINLLPKFLKDMKLSQRVVIFDILTKLGHGIFYIF